MHDLKLPIGPQHPAVDEPSSLIVTIENNRIINSNLKLGYAHIGIEKLMEGKTIEQGLHIVDHICGICSVAHPSCYTRVIEKMINYKPTMRVQYIRTLTSELARMQSHIFWAGFMLHEIGLETMLAYFLRDREFVLETLEKLTGNRIHFAIHKIRTVRNDIDEDDIQFIKKNIAKLGKNILNSMKIIETDKNIKKRLVGIGIIPKRMAKKYSLIGPVARASGISIDVRKDDPYEAYNEVDFDIITETNGDAYARMLVRMREILESIKIVKQIIENIPKEPIPTLPPLFIEEGMEAASVEAPRGENFHLIKIKNKKIDRARIRTPTFNFMSIFGKLLEGNYVDDVPVILTSLDPCYSCLERVIVIKNKKIEVLNEDGFRRKYV
jgi:NADH-quinone oxidoreductase subunit D